MSCVVITCIPSPYQVELFDGLARRAPDFRAVYLSRRDHSRSWASRRLQHAAMVLDAAEPGYRQFFRWTEAADLVVFSDYSSKPVREAMRRRATLGKPWCFWGERPGYHGLGSLGRMRRRLHLAPLHRHRHVPIWGIGKWAIDGYRREFGDARPYWNVPYFSDLRRFRVASAARGAGCKPVRILYCGSLIRRKGVDILARAFHRLGRQRQEVTLSVAGTGPLRAFMERALSCLGQRVRFHGFVPWEELPNAYAQADILCAPSRYDGWGLIVPEGMAAAMPVIATDRMGSALELLEHGRNGWRIGADDEDCLYAALCAAVDAAPAERLAMGISAQSRAAGQDVAEGVRCFGKAMEGTIAAW